MQETIAFTRESPIPIGSDSSVHLLQSQDEAVVKSEKYCVDLGVWSGPYDLLLKVIDEQEMNLFDLNISELLFHYLEYLDRLELINLEEAGEFLVVGATLAQIKSKMLLPKDEQSEDEDEDQNDPRDELVRYLIEYKRFKEAAERLRERPLLNRDVFVKGAKENFPGLEAEGSGKLFQLVKGFQVALKRVAHKQNFEIELEEVSVSERFHEIFTMLRERSEIEFQELLPATGSRVYLIASFLAVLEMVRLKKVKILQWETGERLFLKLNPGASDEDVVHSEFDEEEASEESSV